MFCNKHIDQLLYKMFNTLTNELIGKIYEYDPTYKDIYNNVLEELKKNTLHIRI